VCNINSYINKFEEVYRMRKLAFLMALVLTLGVAGMASATSATIQAVSFNEASDAGHADAKLLKDTATTNMIAGTGDVLTIEGGKLNGLGWTTLKNAIAAWSAIPTNVSFELVLKDQDEIPASVFKGVEVITSITLDPSTLTPPVNITKINDGTFEGMTELTTFDFNQPASTITVLPDNMLKGATELTSVNIAPTSITTIGAGAFGGASKLAGPITAGSPIIASANVTTIGAGAFAGTAITAFPIAAADVTRLVTIGAGAFENCAKLTGVDLQLAEDLTTIGDNAFSGNVKLDVFEFPTPQPIPGVPGENTNELVTIGAGAFKGCKNLLKSFTAVSVMGELYFKEFRKLETIGASAFEGCEEITRIDFTAVENLTEIGDAAFKNAKKLASTLNTFNDAVLTSFGANVFYGTQLVSTTVLNIRFADGVTKIGANAFWQTTPQVLFRYDTDKPALTTPKALSDFLNSVDMVGAFAGANVGGGTIRIADAAFRENGRTLSNLGIVLENRVENPDTQIVVGALYRAGFTPVGIARAFDTASGNPGSLINPTYPLTIEVVEKIVKGIIEGDGDYDYEDIAGSPSDPGTPGGPADPGTPGGGDDDLPADGGSSGCDVTGFAPLAALLALGLAKVRKARG
jgi:hypothetical protein